MKFYGLPMLKRKHEKELLIADGRGGYLFMPSDGLLRRKYHGLWIASLNPPFNRYVILCGIRVYSDGALIASPLKQDGVPAVMAELDGWKASFVYLNGFKISYTFSEGLEVYFSSPAVVEPLLAMRHIYDANRAIEGFKISENGVTKAGIEVEFDQPIKVDPKAVHVEFEIDKERGEECEEVLLSPGRITVDERLGITFPAYSKIKRAQEFNPADQFIVRGPYARRFLIAGYPWFGVWTRDALISIPGLLTIRGRYAEARGIMLSLLFHKRNGELPEYLEERTGRPVYGSVDSTLWLTYALRHYMQYTDDVKFLERIYPDLKSIVLSHGRGLLEHGPATWMDVNLDGKFVIDRSGMAVEVEALWIDLLDLYEKTCVELNKECEVEGLAPKLLTLFEERFWNGRWYRDTLKNDELRPNQLIALALLPLNEDRARTALKFVWEKLATPFGTRTLSPDYPDYRGRYEGDLRSRDLAYHNGTAWPWLSGFLAKASVKYGYDRASVFRAIIEPLLAYMQESFGCLPEVFDGDGPHRPDGCQLQAWSVAEIIRAYHEEYLGREGRYQKKWMFGR